MTQSVPYKRISRNRLQGNHGGGVRLERPEVWIFSLLPTFSSYPPCYTHSVFQDTELAVITFYLVHHCTAENSNRGEILKVSSVKEV